MRHLLFLTHRIPYPPNKGDKIRSYHMLCYLARHYAVHLGTFIDDPVDEAYRSEVQALCATLYCVRLDPRVAKMRSLAGLFTGEALTFPYYRDRRLQRWIKLTLTRHAVDTAIVFSSSMAPYVVGDWPAPVRRILDFVDVDSDKWAQYAATARWPATWLYGRESRKLAESERRFAHAFDASLLVSASEAEFLRRRAPAAAGRILEMRNGVDTSYFDPNRHYENPFRSGEFPLVFTGAMDYWANVDAVQWFATEVLPFVRENCPDVRFVIVGSRPTKTVQALTCLPNVWVTGGVPDVRPYVAHATLVVAPLRIARGIQNKVLEALALGKTVVATGPAAEGIDGGAPLARLDRDTPHDMAQVIIRLLQSPRRSEKLAQAARSFVLRHYDWESNLALLRSLLDGHETTGLGGYDLQGMSTNVR